MNRKDSNHLKFFLLLILQWQLKIIVRGTECCDPQMTLYLLFVLCWSIVDGETVAHFILGGSKITSDGDCSLEIKRLLLLARRVMTNLDRILKSRDITLPLNVHLLKAMVFPVVMYGCES